MLTVEEISVGELAEGLLVVLKPVVDGLLLFVEERIVGELVVGQIC